MFKKFKNKSIKFKDNYFEKGDFVEEVELFGEFDYRSDDEIRRAHNLKQNQYIVNRGKYYYDLREKVFAEGFRKYHQRRFDPSDLDLKEKRHMGYKFKPQKGFIEIEINDDHLITDYNVPPMRMNKDKVHVRYPERPVNGENSFRTNKEVETKLNDKVILKINSEKDKSIKELNKYSKNKDYSIKKEEYKLEDLQQTFYSEGYKVKRDYSSKNLENEEVSTNRNLKNNFSRKSISEKDYYKPLGFNDYSNQTFEHCLIIVRDYLTKAIWDKNYTVSGLIEIVEMIIGDNLTSKIITDEEIKFFKKLLKTLNVIKKKSNTFKTNNPNLTYRITKIVKAIKRDIGKILDK